MKQVILGTAGHIDHGKTTLIKALTGIDTDRLKEEKERGITIELGFAHLELPGGQLLGVVDVPGHEKFIKNMVAGATGIDLVALVIAADEGVIIYTIGFGSPDGEPIPQYGGLGELVGYKKDRNGEVVLSKLDETTLQQIAFITNGRYYRAAADGREVGFLAGAINELQTTELEGRFETRRVERFQWFVAIAIAFLVIGELILDRKRPPE